MQDKLDRRLKRRGEGRRMSRSYSMMAEPRYFFEDVRSSVTNLSISPSSITDGTWGDAGSRYTEISAGRMLTSPDRVNTSCNRRPTARCCPSPYVSGIETFEYTKKRIGYIFLLRGNPSQQDGILVVHWLIMGEEKGERVYWCRSRAPSLP